MFWSSPSQSSGNLPVATDPQLLTRLLFPVPVDADLDGLYQYAPEIRLASVALPQKR